MMAPTTLLTIVLSCGLAVTSVAKEGILKISPWQADVNSAFSLLSRNSLPEVEAVVESGTLEETIALRAAFTKLPPSEFKTEVLLYFLKQPTSFWQGGIGQLAEGDVAAGFSWHVVHYAREQFGVDLVRSTLLSTIDGRKQIAQMIRDKLERKEPPPPDSLPSALEPRDSGKPPAPVSNPIGTSPVEVEPHRKRPLWIVMVSGAVAVAVAVGAAFVLRARRGRG